MCCVVVKIIVKFATIMGKLKKLTGDWNYATAPLSAERLGGTWLGKIKNVSSAAVILIVFIIYIIYILFGDGEKKT